MFIKNPITIGGSSLRQKEVRHAEQERITEESGSASLDDIPEEPVTAAQLEEMEAEQMYAAAKAKAIRLGASLVGTVVSIKA